MRDMISRFAPAPTGFLHLGHVVNAVYVWRETRARGGRVLLRIEDHDRQRSRREYEAEILDDLAWLGFAADEPAVRQSERGAIYEQALDVLRRQGRVYACRCSRADVGAPVQGARTSERGDVGTPFQGARTSERSDVGVPVQGARTSERSDVGAPVQGARTSERGDVGVPFQGARPSGLRYPGTCRDRGIAEGP